MIIIIAAIIGIVVNANGEYGTGTIVTMCILAFYFDSKLKKIIKAEDIEDEDDVDL